METSYITGIKYDDSKSKIIAYKYEYKKDDGKWYWIKKDFNQMVEILKSGQRVKTKKDGKVGEDVELRITTVANGKTTDNLSALPEF